MTLEITRLLEIPADSDLRQIRKAYRQQRKRTDPDMIHQLDRLDHAYEEAVRWFREHPGEKTSDSSFVQVPVPSEKRTFLPKTPHYPERHERDFSSRYTAARAETGICSSEQLWAMHFLGIVPGCSIEKAKKLARDRGEDETEIQKAAGILEQMQAEEPRWKRDLRMLGMAFLALFPAILTHPVYEAILYSGTDLFPDHSDPELAQWFSGTLIASTLTAVLFTVTVPVLFFFILRWQGSRKRKFRRLGVTPAAASLQHNWPADIALGILIVSLLSCITGPSFYRNTKNYWLDYENMRDEVYVTAQAIDPDFTYLDHAYSELGSLYEIGGDQIVDVRYDLAYDENPVAESYGRIHEVTYIHLPHTGLAVDADVHTWYLTNTYPNDGGYTEQFYPIERTLTIGQSGLVRLYDTVFYSEPAGEKLTSFYLDTLLNTDEISLRERQHIWFDERSERIFLILAYTDETAHRDNTAVISMDRDGNIIHSHVIADYQPEYIFMLDNGDIVFAALYVFADGTSFQLGTSAMGVHLDGGDLSPKGISDKSIRIAPYSWEEYGAVSEKGIEILFYDYSDAGGSLQETAETVFVPIG